MKKSGLTVFFILLAVWSAVLVGVIVVFCAGSAGAFSVNPSAYYIVTVIVSFSSFAATSFFGLAVYRHNAAVRDQNNEIRHQTNAVNRRAEAFRNLQFISSNYTIIDFIDNMQIYEEGERYREKLRDTGSFDFYLLEKGTAKDDVIKNFDGYVFLTVRLPFAVVEGIKTLSRLKISQFKFEKPGNTYRFVPSDGAHASALILYNEAEHRSEAVVNLVMRKDGDFYKLGEINPFLKIKTHLEMESLLGVTVAGSIELYFTNPENIEESGANKYAINSSQFELAGMPRLAVSKEFIPD
ncbi:MAG: hypothetical protein LBP26_04090 [Clostridiales bacterium]|jgi:hypothetical protein|nr:hypothetical protein [Clostridiales bacterium]